MTTTPTARAKERRARTVAATITIVVVPADWATAILVTSTVMRRSRIPVNLLMELAVRKDATRTAWPKNATQRHKERCVREKTKQPKRKK